MICWSTDQLSSRWSSWGRNWWVATTNVTAMITVTQAQPRDRARHADTAATTSAGATHTQWCDHEVGETRSATAAVAISASGAGARRMLGTASINRQADRTSHPAVRSNPVIPARVNTAWKVWLVKNGDPLIPPAPA